MTRNSVRDYYWIAAKLGGRLVVIGPKDSEQEANEFGYATLEIPFEVIPLPTVDRRRATSQIKARYLGESHDLGGALQPARHQIPTTNQQTSPSNYNSGGV